MKKIIDSFFNQIIKKKKKIIELNSGDEYPWLKGEKLTCTEKSAFIIPGTITKELNSKTNFGNIFEISDKDTVIMAVSDKEAEYPNFAIILKPGVSMRINKKCVVTHVHIKGENKRRKKFTLEK